MNHLIQRQELQIELLGERSPFTVQSRLRDWFNTQLLPVIEKACDRVSTEEELLIIDRLEIDLGQLQTQALNGQGVQLHFQRLLEAALRDALEGLTAAKVTKQTVAEHRFERWLAFLRTGVQPWQTRTETKPVEAEFFDFLRSSGAAQARLQELVSTSPLALRRLVLQYTGQTWEALLSTATDGNYKGLIDEVEQLSKLLDQKGERKSEVGPSSRRLIDWRFWLTQRVLAQAKRTVSLRELLVELLLTRLSPEEQRAIATIFNKKAAKTSAAWRAAYAEVEKSNPDFGSVQPFSGEPVKDERNRVGGTEVSSLEQPTTDLARAKTKPPVEVNELEQTKMEAGTQETQEDTPKDQALDGVAAEESLADLPDELYIEQAGVVLLYPFLERYFERIGLVMNKAFVDTAAQHRAALLLHWLASGETDTPETTLTIHKHLCGIPLNYPLPRQWTISPEEMQEGESLLQAVIAHWGALGEVSNASLREGFLLRPGKLSRRGGRWLLQPEQRTIDLLLGKLPWGIGIIKFPWMPELLTVEWA